MQWLSYVFVRVAAGLFRLVPFPVLYVLSDALAFFLYRVLGYRKKVIFDNLRRVFPEKTDAELEHIARGAYRNLTDITLETIKSFTASMHEVRRRCRCVNPELVNGYLDAGRSVIISGSHYNNWELACLVIPEGFHGKAITAYKPLSNKLIDAWFNRNRGRSGMIMAGMDELFGFLRKYRGQPAAFLLVADQSPSSQKSAHWVSFLGQQSASLPGVDVLARKFDYPVLYFHVRRVRRGFYEVEYVDLWPDPARAAEADITRAYARHAEAEIYARPENWLWSHKRWKIKANHPSHS